MRHILILLSLILGIPALAPLLVGAPALADDAAAPTPIEVAGGSYHVSAPPGWDGKSPIPVVIFFHGYGQSGEVVIKNRRLTEPFGKAGVLLVAPTGLGKSWGHVGSPRRMRDENAFIDAMLADVTARFAVDPDRIWASGFSQGGSMAWDAACYRGDRFDAIFPIAGAFWRPHPEACSSGPVNLFHTHGTGDKVVPMTGRPIAGAFHQGDVMDGIALWKDANRCPAEPERVETMGDLRCEIWSDCESARALKLCLHPGGHIVPEGWIEMAVAWANRVSGD
jgi:polyhydroxybutyrate depolymerase